MASVPLPRTANAIALTASWAVIVLLLAAAVLYAIYGPEVDSSIAPDSSSSAEQLGEAQVTEITVEEAPEETAEAAPKLTEDSALEGTLTSEESSDTLSDTANFAPEPEVTEIPLPAPGESQGNETQASGAQDDTAGAEPGRAGTGDQVETVGSDETTARASLGNASEEATPADATAAQITPDEPASALEGTDLQDDAPPPIPDTEGNLAAEHKIAEEEPSVVVEEPQEAVAPSEIEPRDEVPLEEKQREPEAQENAEAEAQQLAALTPLESRPDVAWQRFRSPFNIDDRQPRIAVVISGLGLASRITEAAIKRLPPAVTLSFSPYARNLEAHIAQARADGHEVMLDLPMEPMDFPQRDPGPQALLTGADESTNLARLRWIMDRGSAYVGLATVMGSRFTSSPNHMRPILELIRDRGLLFLDNGSSGRDVSARLAQDLQVPVAVNNRAIDGPQASREAIDARLAEVERIALTDGFAVAMGQPYPVTLERIATWAENLDERGFTLAPITALANRQPIP